MPDSVPASSFARVSPGAARSVLLVSLAVIVSFVAISLSPLAGGFVSQHPTGPGDVPLYLAEIQRISHGEGYYEAASHELHARGYPTLSTFNWRTPLPMWLLGKLPNQTAGRLLIGGLALLLLVLAVIMVARDGGILRALGCGLMMSGALLPGWLEQIYVMPVVWGGILICLSICAYGLDRPGWGVAFGLAAVVLRELAASYCVICLLLALYDRRWREALAWVIGLAAFLAFYAWHALHVMTLVQPGDHAHTTSWLQFGGASFVIAIAQMNAYLLLLPQWVSAIYLPLAMLGFAGWNTATGRRAGLTACGFVIFFAFIGQPFNQYWGSLIAPLLTLGAAQAPTAISDLFRRSRSLECDQAATLASANI
ncbi:MAG TPA: hypothetical protein VMJ32_17510 [Pirellulales bacterium]|nr:hypothetical protein [Pirellulales bacterium]